MDPDGYTKRVSGVPAASPNAISPRRIVRSLKNPPSCVTQLVQLDSGQVANARRFSAILNNENSVSELMSCVDEAVETSISSYFDRCGPTHSLNNVKRKGKRRKSGAPGRGGEFESSVLSYSGTQMSYSSLSSSSTGSSTCSTYTAVSESVPSCSLTAVDNNNNKPGRLRKALASAHHHQPGNSASFSSIFGGVDSDGHNLSHGPASIADTGAGAGAAAAAAPLHGKHLLCSNGGDSSMSHVDGRPQTDEDMTTTLTENGDVGGLTVGGSTSAPSPANQNGGGASRTEEAPSTKVGPRKPSGLGTSGGVAAKGQQRGSGAGAAGGKESNAAGGGGGGMSGNASASNGSSGVPAAAGGKAGDSPSSPATDGGSGGWRVTRVERLERIGRGSYGDVYRGLDKDTGRVVAIKEILVPKDFTKDLEKQLETIEREISVMRKLHHPNIINYLGASRDDNCLSIFMEYVSGGSIGSILKAEGPFSEERTRELTRQILSGLQYLHGRKILHRDLKGDNLFLTDDAVVKVGDFGTSKELVTTLVTDSIAGTPNFMAPEVIACSGHSYAADVWSIGCCVIEMLTGAPPFSKMDNHMAVMFAIMKGKLDSEIPERISDGAKSFIKACTKFATDERWTAEQLMGHPWMLEGVATSPNAEGAAKSDAKEKSSTERADSPTSPARAMQRRRSVAAAFKGAAADAIIQQQQQQQHVHQRTTSKSSKGSTGANASGAISPKKRRLKSQSPTARPHAKTLDVLALERAANSDNNSNANTSNSNNNSGADGLVSDRHSTDGSTSQRHDPTSPRQPRPKLSRPHSSAKKAESANTSGFTPHPPDTTSPQGRRGNSGPYSTTAATRSRVSAPSGAQTERSGMRTTKRQTSGKGRSN